MTDTPTLHRDRGNTCFGCGLANPDGLGLDFQPDPEDPRRSVVSTPSIARRFTGAPQFLHGGIVATLLDEAMAKANALSGITAVTHQLSVDYRRPVPAEQAVTIGARQVRVQGRRVYSQAWVHDSEGRVLAEGRGRFIKLSREAINRLTGSKPATEDGCGKQ